MDNYSSAVLLIDADNTPCSKLDAILTEFASIPVKRAYGNWSKPCLKNWERVLQRHGIRAVQQFDCAVGKNATDIALAVDAMDLLHSGRYDTFLLAASDSDYAPLALRLRESGAEIIGIGKADTPMAYVSACNLFRTLDSFPSLTDDLNQPIDTAFLFDEDDLMAASACGLEDDLPELDDISPVSDTPDAEDETSSDDLQGLLDSLFDESPATVVEEDPFADFPDFGPDEPDEVPLQDIPNESGDICWDTQDALLPPVLSEDRPELRSVHKLLQVAYDICKGEDGFAPLSSTGNFIREIRPEFDYRSYGFHQLHELLEAFPERYQLITYTYPRDARAKVMAFRCCA